MSRNELLDNNEYDDIKDDSYWEIQDKYGGIVSLEIPRPAKSPAQDDPGVGLVFVVFSAVDNAIKAQVSFAYDWLNQDVISKLVGSLVQDSAEYLSRALPSRLHRTTLAWAWCSSCSAPWTMPSRLRWPALTADSTCTPYLPWRGSGLCRVQRRGQCHQGSGDHRSQLTEYAHHAYPAMGLVLVVFSAMDNAIKAQVTTASLPTDFAYHAYPGVGLVFVVFSAMDNGIKAQVTTARCQLILHTMLTLAWAWSSSCSAPWTMPSRLR